MPEPAPPETAPHPTPTPRLRRAAAIALGIALALACLEGVIREVFWLRNVWDPSFGSIVRPGDTVRYWREGHGHSHWTDSGVRRAAPPDPAQRPILAVGDSFTEAFNVDDGDVYTRLLEARLAAAGAAIPVVNAGRSGGSPADYVAFAPRFRALFAPRWTIVELRPEDLEVEGFDPGRTHFERDAAGALVAVPVVVPFSRFNALLAPLRNASALANYTIVRSREFAAATADEPPLFRAGSALRKSAPSPRDDATMAAMLASLARAYDGRVTLLLLPDFDPRAPGAVTSQAERVFARTCAAQSLSCANLRDAFAGFAARFEAPYGFPNSAWNWGHMNEAGHAAVAALLDAELARLRARDLL